MFASVKRTAIGAQREEVVRRDGLGLAALLQHEELRQNGDRLQVDAERLKAQNVGWTPVTSGTYPKDLLWREFGVDEEREHCAWDDEDLHPECVLFAVVCGAESRVHQVDGCDQRDDEENLKGKAYFCPKKAVESVNFGQPRMNGGFSRSAQPKEYDCLLAVGRPYSDYRFVLADFESKRQLASVWKDLTAYKKNCSPLEIDFRLLKTG